MSHEFIDRLFLFLERILPGLLGAFGLGLYVANAKTRKAEKLLNQALLEKELAENETEIGKRFNGLSDDDVIRSVFKGRQSGGSDTSH